MQKKPLIFRLDPASRARVLLLLALIVFLAVLAVAFIRLTGRLVRLYTRGSYYRSPWSIPPGAIDDWAVKPLVPPVEPLREDSPGQENKDHLPPS